MIGKYCPSYWIVGHATDYPVVLNITKPYPTWWTNLVAHARENGEPELFNNAAFWEVAERYKIYPHIPKGFGYTELRFKTEKEAMWFLLNWS